MNKTTPAFWDRLGIGISGFCAIHCLFFPVAVAVMPLWPAAGAIHEWTHPLLFLLIVPTVLFAMKGGVKDLRIPVFLYSGLSTVGMAWLLHGWIGDIGEAAVTLVGSGLLVTGHWHNYSIHKKRCQMEVHHEKT